MYFNTIPMYHKKMCVHVDSQNMTVGFVTSGSGGRNKNNIEVNIYPVTMRDLYY